MSIPIFIAVGGQRDNIGDTVLRRNLLNVLRSAGELHITTGSAPDTYISGLELSESDVVYGNRRDWRKSSLSSTRSGRVAWAFHSGELTMSAPVVRSYLAMSPLIAYLRLSGGVGVHSGLGLRTASSERPSDRLGAVAVGLALKACAVVTWRDGLSARRTRTGTVSPDWAFRSGKPAGSATIGERTLLTVSIRHDRPGPTDAYADAVKRFAGDHSLEIMMVAQTERDLGPAREHAARFGAEVAEWNTSDLAAAEKELRALYRRTAVAISNRLHGYVIAGTEGATPVGITMGSPEKLDRTLAAAGLSETGLDSLGRSSSDIYRHIQRAVRRSTKIQDGFEVAASRLDILSEHIVSVVLDQPPTQRTAPDAASPNILNSGGIS